MVANGGKSLGKQGGGGGPFGQRRLVHEKWEIVQVGAVTSQSVPITRKLGWGVAGHWGKDDMFKKSGNCALSDVQLWWGVGVIWAKSTCPRKVGICK